jgi:hypothetical protein
MLRELQGIRMSCEDVHSGFKSILAMTGCDQKNAVVKSEVGKISQEASLPPMPCFLLRWGGLMRLKPL